MSYSASQIKFYFRHFFLISALSILFSFHSELHSQGYICAIGGGSENYNDWSNAPYSWIVQKADSGKIIIISDADASTWLPNYFMSLGADTAYNKTISSVSVANLQTTYDELITAKAIFIRGGDQWDYIRLWKGTKTDSAINYVFQNGGVIAGTSAGAAVLGEVDYSARNGSVYPDEALLNPFNSYMQFEDNFLKLTPNVLFDTHFIERGRHGRLIAMLYNRYLAAGRDLIGIGVDDRTAFCISPDGIGEVMGSGAVAIFYKDALTKYSTFTSSKYTIENLKSQMLTKGWKFNLANREIAFVPASAKDLDTSRAWFYPQTDFYLTGTNTISSQLSTNLTAFLSEVNNSSIAVISHPGYAATLNTLTGFLTSNSYNYSVLNLSLSNLNDPAEASKINNASCFIFAGDSLNVLSYLNQPAGLVNAAFYNSVALGKPVFFFGNAGKIAGDKFIANTDTDIYASYRGKMTINDGLFMFPELIFQPLIFDNSDFYENRTSAVLWGMMRNRKRLGIYLNGTGRIKINSLEKSISGNSSLPYIIVNVRSTTKVDSSTYRASSSIGPRQVAAMNNVRFSLTNYPDIKYLIQDGKFDNLTRVEYNASDALPDNFILYQNYPNPFNPSTRISWQSPVSSHQTLKIFDLLGNEVATLVDEFIQAGNYFVEFNFVETCHGKTLSSGVYFYQLKSGDVTLTKKMILLR